MHLPIPSLTERQLARFNASFTRRASGCWEWTQETSQRGYGQFSANSRTYGAHRISYAVAKADPGAMHVCHTCDNPPCVNPEHLWLGTPSDNMRDMLAKGRGNRATSGSEYCSKCGHHRTDDYVQRSGTGRCRGCQIMRDAKRDRRTIAPSI